MTVAALLVVLAVRRSGGTLQVTNVVPYVCATAPKIQRDVPITRSGDTNACREASEAPAEVVKLTAGSIVREISVVHNADIALMTAFHDHNVALLKVISIVNKIH
jgi:hypothetical protein